MMGQKFLRTTMFLYKIQDGMTPANTEAEEMKTMKNALVLGMIAALLLTTTASAVDVNKPGNHIAVIEKKTSDGPSAAKTMSEFGLAPRVTLSLASTLTSNIENRGTMTWNDPDNKVISVFLTIFFHDGDVATVTLFDTREGDTPASKGRVTFGLTPAGYNPPLGSNGFAYVTVTD